MKISNIFENLKRRTRLKIDISFLLELPWPIGKILAILALSRKRPFHKL